MFAVVSVIIACCILNLSSSFSTDWSTEFNYNTYIDENQLFKLYWTNLENDMIEFGIEAAGTGWIAIGLFIVLCFPSTYFSLHKLFHNQMLTIRYFSNGSNAK